MRDQFADAFFDEFAQHDDERLSSHLTRLPELGDTHRLATGVRDVAPRPNTFHRRPALAREAGGRWSVAVSGKLAPRGQPVRTAGHARVLQIGCVCRTPAHSWSWATDRSG